MRPLVIDCSPRVGGNSDIIVSHIGALFDVDIVYMRELEYAFCNGCETCTETHRCVHDDSATALYENILERDTVIFVSPVYFYSFDGHTKGFIDRAQYLWSREKSMDRTRSLYLIGVGGQDFEDNFTPMERTMTCLAYTLGARYKGGLFFRGIDNAGDIDTDIHMHSIDDFLANITRRV